MTYARFENDQIVEYPVYEGDIRLRYPNTSFPREFVPPEGYEAVTDVPMPRVDHTKNVAEGTPERVNDVLVRVWAVTDASEEQVAARTDAQWKLVRKQRNDKLAACDWTQLSDAPVDATAWATYRQALRDITIQADPFNIVWPTAP
jgi:hypothetical protein